MDAKMNNKKSQITIFIIIAIIVVVGIILFFVLRGDIKFPGTVTITPDVKIDTDKCVEDSVLNVINIILPQGGWITPNHYKLYKNNKVEYLCYNQNWYFPCINQNPMFIEHIKNQIVIGSKNKIKDCFYNIEQDYRKKGFSIISGPENISFNLRKGQVEVIVDKKLQLTKNEQTKNYDQFKFIINTPIQDLAVVANEIASQESVYCNFEYVGYSLTYPQFHIEKKSVGDESSIYIIKDKLSGKQLLIAIRGCALPGGIV